MSDHDVEEKMVFWLFVIDLGICSSRRTSYEAGVRRQPVRKYPSSGQQPRFYVLGLIDPRAAYYAHDRRPHRCLVRLRADAFLVYRGRFRHSWSKRQVAAFSYFMPTMVEADERGGLGRWRRQGCPSRDEQLYGRQGRHV